MFDFIALASWSKGEIKSLKRKWGGVLFLILMFTFKKLSIFFPQH